MMEQGAHRGNNLCASFLPRSLQKKLTKICVIFRKIIPCHSEKIW